MRILAPLLLLFLFGPVFAGEFRIKFTHNSPKIDDPLAKDIWIGELGSDEIVITISEGKRPAR